MMSAFVSEDQDEEPSGIPDPFAGPDEQYEETFDVLIALIEKTLSRLEPILAP
jgi:protein-tyrosine-phosphatase